MTRAADGDEELLPEEAGEEAATAERNADDFPDDLASAILNEPQVDEIGRAHV